MEKTSHLKTYLFESDVAVVFRAFHIFDDGVEHFFAPDLLTATLAEVNQTFFRKFAFAIKTFPLHF